jgi:hypothetical protein
VTTSASSGGPGSSRENPFSAAVREPRL